MENQSFPDIFEPFCFENIFFVFFLESCELIIQKHIEIWSIFEKTTTHSYITGTFDSFSSWCSPNERNLSKCRVKSVGDTRHRRTHGSKVSGIHGLGGRPSQKCRGYTASEDARVKPRDDTSTQDTPDRSSTHICFGTWPPIISIDGSTHTTPDH